MKRISFNTYNEAKSVCDRVKSDALNSGVISDDLIGYVIPVKTEFWSIPIIDGFEKFFTKEEFIDSSIVENSFNKIKPSQGKIQLYRLGLLEIVSNMIENSTDTELKLFWEYALIWEIDNVYISQLAASLGLDGEAIASFFFEASKIQ